MGLPHLNFWFYLALPHAFLALVVVGYVWKRGILHSFPTAYVLGFVAFLALAFVHQQTFLRNQFDWRGIHLFTIKLISRDVGGSLPDNRLQRRHDHNRTRPPTPRK
jgi:hypothetical protein